MSELIGQPEPGKKSGIVERLTAELPRPKTLFIFIAAGLLFWAFFAPGGFVTCRPTATGNMIVDYPCEPMLDTTFPEESAEARRKFWAAGQNAKP